MSHTYISDLVHCVFSTKLRRDLISTKIQPDLWAFVGGIARKNEFKALTVGGTENHLHVLLSLPATMSLAQSDAIAKRRLLSLDERDTHARVRVAGRVRRFHRRDFAEE